MPVEEAITHRTQTWHTSNHPDRKAWWAGDVWRTALLLKRRRPDLAITSLDSAPTGLVLITNLNSNNFALKNDYNCHVKEMMSWDLGHIGIKRYFEEMGLEPTAGLASSEQITARFWL